jgi:flavin-binding protein dodecin
VGRAEGSLQGSGGDCREQERDHRAGIPRVRRPRTVDSSIPRHWELAMSIAKVTEITATSSKSFDDAVRAGIKRAGKTLKNIKGVWIKGFKVDVVNNEIKDYRVDLKVTFVLED